MTPTREQLMEALIDCRECLDRCESYIAGQNRSFIELAKLMGWKTPPFQAPGVDLLIEVQRVLDKTSPLVSSEGK